MSSDLAHSQDEQYITEKRHTYLYKRTLAIIIVAQLFSGLALTAGITVGALIAKSMLGSNAYAGLPIGILTFGAALAAYLVGRSSNRWGRRLGLTLGFLVGAIGAALIVLAMIIGNVYLFFLALFLYGAGSAANLQARYAGVDLANKHQRATAISIAMVATTFGAIIGPNLVDVMDSTVNNGSLPQYSGIFVLAGVAYFLSSIVIFIGLRPDPLLLAKRLTTINMKQEQNFKEVKEQGSKGIWLGTSILLLNQLVMASIMTMTPIHMGHFHHHISDIGLVISIHVGAMYLPSLFSGILADKIGKVRMTWLSGIVLGFAALLAAFAPGESLFAMILSLGLLGVGWNFGMIAGTTMIVDATTIQTRAKKQGLVDVYISIAGASGGMFSGVIVVATSYQWLALIGLFMCILFVAVMTISNRRKSS